MKSKNTQTLVDTNLVFALASRAWRENNGFAKQSEYDQEGDLVKKANKKLVSAYLETNTQPSEADYELAKAVIFYCKTMIVQALMEPLSDFEGALLKLTYQSELDVSETSSGRFNIGVAAAAVNSYFQNLTRKEVENRLDQVEKTPIDKENEQIITDIEVICSRFSVQWQCWYVTAITASNHAVWFSYREQLPLGSHFTLKGRIKRYDDKGQTQLTRVKLAVIEPAI